VIKLVSLKIIKKFIELYDPGNSPRHFYNFVITLIELSERKALISGAKLNMGEISRKYHTPRARILDTWRTFNELGYLVAQNAKGSSRYFVKLGPVFQEYFAAIMLENNEFPGDDFIKILFKQFFQTTRDSFAKELTNAINNSMAPSFKELYPELWKFLPDDEKEILEVYETYAGQLDISEFGVFEKICKMYPRLDILEGIKKTYSDDTEENFLRKYGVRALDNYLSLKVKKEELK
jgi:hypothetical protein